MKLVHDLTRTWTRRAASPLLALLVHVLIGTALYVVPPRAPVPREPSPSPSTPTPAEPAPEIDVTTEAAMTRPPSASAPTEAEPGAGERTIASVTRPPQPAARERTLPTEPVAPPASAPAEPPRATEGAVDSPSVITMRSAPEIGVGGTNRFLPKSEAQVEAAESKRAIDDSLRTAATARDQALGLGPEGPVLTALADGTMRSLAPVKGRAIFVATSNAEGIVVSLELADAEGGRPGWADAGRLALANLNGKKLRVVPGTTRSVMRIEVESTWKLPSGHDPGADISLFHIPLSKGEGPKSSQISILDPIPRFSVHWIELAGPTGPKIPLVTIELNILKIAGDPVDIGASPRRVIHTHVVDSQAM